MSAWAAVGSPLPTVTVLRLHGLPSESHPPATCKSIMGEAVTERSDGCLFNPMNLGSFILSHRVVLAPLTRNRAVPSDRHQRTWVPRLPLTAIYYAERATPGGLLISEATPISLRASGALGIAGLFTDEQVGGWSPVVQAVHAKGGVFFCQLWHQGRNAHSRMTGLDIWAPSAIPITDNEHHIRNAHLAPPPYPSDGLPLPFETPHAMTMDEILQVQQEYVDAALRAREAGFDGIELHAANGYLPDQFHNSNINARNDAYGGSLKNRCRFTLELVQKLCETIGADRVGVRLSPLGMFNQTRGEDRITQFVYLCGELSKLQIAYIHLIEPRFDEFQTEVQKVATITNSADGAPLAAADAPHAVNSDKLERKFTLQPFRAVISPPTRVIAAGGYNWSNCRQGLERGDHDAVAFGRYFTSNPDLVQRLQTGQRLYRYDRPTFYGPFAEPEKGYTERVRDDWADASDHGQAQLVEASSATA